MSNRSRYYYHHVGIPTNIKREDEEYNKEWKFYANGYFESKFGAEWLRIEEDSLLHPLIKSFPHVAFVVDDFNKAIKGKNIIYGPNNPAKGVTVCFIEEKGLPIELLKFDKSENEIWPNDNKLTNPIFLQEKKEVLFNYKYHHLGIYSELGSQNVQHIENLLINNVNIEKGDFGIRFFNFKKLERYTLPKIIKDIPHIAFMVRNLEEVIKDKNIVIEPIELNSNKLVAFVEENGVPIMLIEERSAIGFN
ncbi:MAG: hypothetical protein WAO74_11510 [Polaribacter sp.]|uniref:hypothetical protein n=1 Tax=Polaribacter sp. TaxID=1920175 RepID=UPI003BB0911E